MSSLVQQVWLIDLQVNALRHKGKYMYDFQLGRLFLSQESQVVNLLKASDRTLLFLSGR